MSKSAFVVAYLAPEIPSLSATFVQDELLALERRGFVVLPISVHLPAVQINQDLAARCYAVYECSRLRLVSYGVVNLFGVPGFFKALCWLMKDLVDLGGKGRRTKVVFQFLAAVKVARMLGAQGVKHLHIHFAHVPTQIGMYAAAMAGIPFTVMAHANDIFERAFLLSTKAQRAKKFLTISDFNRAYLERCGVPAAKLAVVRCGVQVLDEKRSQVGSVKARYRIGSLGRLVEKKGFDVLIEAVAILKQRGHELELLIAGDGPLRNELTALVQQLELSTSVTFVGSLSHSAVPAWMDSLDVFALACKPDANGDMDGIPVVLMEAMAQGLPVVSTRLSGIPELVMHQRSGLLAEPGDVQGMAAQLERLMTCPEYAKALAEHGQAHVRNEFGQDVNIDRLLSHMNISV